MIGDNVTKKKEEREYAKNREEYFREFHSVVAPVVVLKAYDYERLTNQIFLYSIWWNRDCIMDLTTICLGTINSFMKKWK